MSVIKFWSNLLNNEVELRFSMPRKHSSKSWTGKVPSDKYYRDWANRLGVSGPYGLLTGCAAL